MSETARPTTRLSWWQKALSFAIVAPVVLIVLGLLWGAVAWVWRWAP